MIIKYKLGPRFIHETIVNDMNTIPAKDDIVTVSTNDICIAGVVRQRSFLLDKNVTKEVIVHLVDLS